MASYNTREKAAFWTVFLAGVAVIVAYAFYTLSATNTATAGQANTAIPEGDFPKVEISVSGEAEGKIVLTLRPDLAPQHVERILQLAADGAYDNVVFHRVIEGFMAQTGDVEFGKTDVNPGRAGTGGSSYPDLPAEFSSEPYLAGTVGMARSQSPNSANSQFFIMFDPAPFLDGKYTVVGHVSEGFDVVKNIKLGKGSNGAIIGDPDVMTSMKVMK
jgi:peptidylprolyl isomerase